MIEPIHSDRSVQQHVRMVFITCRRNTPSEDSAWEAFQETFLAFSRRRDTLDLDSDYGPWLRETARRCCFAVVRKERRQPITGMEDIGTVAPTVSEDQADAASFSEVKSVLQEEIQQLSVEDQDLLRCLYDEGMTHRDIAEQLKCPSGSVYAKAEDARSRLRKRLERRGVVVGAMLLLFLLQVKAEAGWTPAIVAPRKTTSPPKASWRSVLLATLAILAAIIPAGLYLPVSLAATSTMADISEESDSQSDSHSDCGCEDPAGTVQ